MATTAPARNEAIESSLPPETLLIPFPAHTDRYRRNGQTD